MSPRVVDDLAPAERRALEILRGGGRIEARRTFPCPHRYYRVDADGGNRAELTKANVANLLEARLITAKPLDGACDAINYYAAKVAE